MTEVPDKMDFRTHLAEHVSWIKRQAVVDSRYDEFRFTEWRPRSSNLVLPSIARTLGDLRRNFYIPEGGGRSILEMLHAAFPYSTYSSISGERFGILYHGSPVPPDEMGEVLRPFQSVWANQYGRFLDGTQPAVSADSSPEIPIIRALLHDKQSAIEALQDKDLLVLTRRKDINNNDLWFTSEKAVQALRNSTGYVYLFIPPRFTQKYIDDVTGQVREEYRVTEEVALIKDSFVPVTVDDLPPHLFILDASHSYAEQVLKKIGRIDPTNFLPRLKDEFQTGVRTLRGDFPRSYYPGLKTK